MKELGTFEKLKGDWCGWNTVSSGEEVEGHRMKVERFRTVSRILDFFFLSMIGSL